MAARIDSTLVFEVTNELDLAPGMVKISISELRSVMAAIDELVPGLVRSVQSNQ